MISKDELFKSIGTFPKYEAVDIPDFGECWIKVLTAGERDKFELAHTKADMADFRARLVVACAIDERGAKVFDDMDMPRLSELPAYILDPLVEVAMRINRFSKSDQDELRKNLNGQAVTS